MRSIPNTRTVPVEVKTSGGAVSTPSSAAGTRANDDFNALIRAAEAIETVPVTLTGPNRALALVDALRDAGFDL